MHLKLTYININYQSYVDNNQGKFRFLSLAICQKVFNKEKPTTLEHKKIKLGENFRSNKKFSSIEVQREIVGRIN